ncbi:MAG: ABC transporter substrate-binding protein [Actinomycetota bacterium]
MLRRTHRGVAIIAASALSLSLAGIGALSSSASATGTDGVTNTSITIGATVPLSGIASTGYSDVAKTANAVFKYINAKGGVNGRKVNFIIKDDCYDIQALGCAQPQTSGSLTVAQTNALINTSGGLFATVGSLGTATQDAVRSLLNSDHIPQLFVNSGSTDWNDPSHYSGLFGWQTDYIAEGKILANYIKSKLAGKKLGFIGQDDDFGANGLLGLQRGGLSIPNMGGTNSFAYPATDAVFNLSFPTTLATLKANAVKVVVLDAVPPAVTLILKDAAKIGYYPQWVISGVGSDPQTVNYANLSKTNPGEMNAVSMTFFPYSTDTTNAWNKWIAKVILADKADFPKFTSKSILSGNMQYGAGWAVTFLQLLKAMGSNVTRANAVSTLEHSAVSNAFATPAVLPLQYSPTNHQGLGGGLLVKIVSNTNTTQIDGKVYSTNDAANGAITQKAFVNAAVPSWLS